MGIFCENGGNDEEISSSIKKLTLIPPLICMGGGINQKRTGYYGKVND